MQPVIIALVLSFFFTFGSAGAVVAAEDTPPTLEGVRVISGEELRALLGDNAVQIYDLRKKASFVEGHVPGALSAARHYNERESTLDLSLLGPDKSAPIVFYSHGAAGWKSYWAAKRSAEAGYRNILWFRGGYAEWEEKSLPVTR